MHETLHALQTYPRDAFEKKMHLTIFFFLLESVWTGQVKKKEWHVGIIIHKTECISGQL